LVTTVPAPLGVQKSKRQLPAVVNKRAAIGSDGVGQHVPKLGHWKLFGVCWSDLTKFKQVSEPAQLALLPHAAIKEPHLSSQVRALITSVQIPLFWHGSSSQPTGGVGEVVVVVASHNVA
jgi:hypothetical protein